MEQREQWQANEQREQYQALLEQCRVAIEFEELKLLEQCRVVTEEDDSQITESTELADGNHRFSDRKS